MKPTLSKALLTLAFAISCHAEDSAAPLPTKLIASIEGFAGASYRVELASDGLLTYLRNPHTFTAWAGTKRTRIRVPAERWPAFRRRLDSANVWSWRHEYINRSVADGTVWHLEVAYNDRKILSDGSNAYPPKKQFEAFCAAIRELIGGKSFE